MFAQKIWRVSIPDQTGTGNFLTLKSESKLFFWIRMPIIGCTKSSKLIIFRFNFTHQGHEYMSTGTR